ncbi:DUF397 domain-containing protein [Streptomyces sp. NPDC093097]|uniref:DUF397 domain-containing protein n=1 Tax=Streptomyces sp. NPDC093097 TaxID=3366027 RepID=UPI00381EEF1D
MIDRLLSESEASAVTWFKSSYSGGEGNACVEVADLRTRVAVRDSKTPDGPILAFPAAAFTAFVADVRALG